MLISSVATEQCFTKQNISSLLTIIKKEEIIKYKLISIPLPFSLEINNLRINK